MKVSRIKLETRDGEIMSITLEEAKELYYELKNIFEIPIVIEPKVYPISSNKPLTEGSFK